MAESTNPDGSAPAFPDDSRFGSIQHDDEEEEIEPEMEDAGPLSKNLAISYSGPLSEEAGRNETSRAGCRIVNSCSL
jgi:hypothetical protein